MLRIAYDFLLLSCCTPFHRFFAVFLLFAEVENKMEDKFKVMEEVEKLRQERADLQVGLEAADISCILSIQAEN